MNDIMTVLMKIRDYKESLNGILERLRKRERGGVEWLAMIHQNHQTRRRQTFFRRGDW